MGKKGRRLKFINNLLFKILIMDPDLPNKSKKPKKSNGREKRFLMKKVNQWPTIYFGEQWMSFAVK